MLRFLLPLLLAGCVSGIPEDDPVTMIPFAHAAAAPTVKTYQRRLYVRNDSKFMIFNAEWYVPECWGNTRWYQNGKELPYGYGPAIKPGKEAEVITEYTPCTSHLESSIYFIFTTDKAAVDTMAFVLTGRASGYHTHLWIKTWSATHTHCYCRDYGFCHFNIVANTRG